MFIFLIDFFKKYSENHDILRYNSFNSDNMDFGRLREWNR